MIYRNNVKRYKGKRMLFSNQSGVGFERVELQQEFGDCREDDPEVFPFGRGNNSVKVLFGKEKKEVYAEIVQ